MELEKRWLSFVTKTKNGAAIGTNNKIIGVPNPRCQY